MNVKTFIGANNRDAMDQIKAEFGMDAIILETKSIEENGKKYICITAGIENEPAPDDIFTSINEGKPEELVQRGLFSGISELSALADKHLATKQETDSPLQAPMARMSADWNKEWSEIKNTIFSLLRPSINLDALSQNQKIAIEYLQNEGASNQLLVELSTHMAKYPNEMVSTSLNHIIQVKPWGAELWQEKIHLIVGSYGSGKTSTAVRMSLLLKKLGLRVCIINADSERGNGRLLLKHYTGLSGIEYKEGGDRFEIQDAINAALKQGFDRIIIDMPGISRKVTLKDTATNLGLTSHKGGVAHHIVLSPNMQDEVLRDMVKRFLIELPASIIWSKVDEAVSYGSMLNIALTCAVPVSCLSYGAGLVNSLSPANKKNLLRLIFKHELPA